MFRINIARSSNGRTSGFGPEYRGSSPCRAAKKLKVFCAWSKALLCDLDSNDGAGTHSVEWVASRCLARKLATASLRGEGEKCNHDPCRAAIDFLFPHGNFGSGGKKMKCGKCGREWVPDFSLDCYKIDEIELCEPCAMPIFMNAAEPTPVDENRSKEVCKIGQGSATCMFLGMQPSFVCLKHTQLDSLLRKSLEEGSMVAKGDNCSGPPAFNIITT